MERISSKLIKGEIKMEAKKLVLEQIEKVREYVNEQEVGTEEYKAGLAHLVTLEEKLAELEKFETTSAVEKKNQFVRNIFEGLKIGVPVVTSFVGLVWITAAEKEITFRGALAEYARHFVPKR